MRIGSLFTGIGGLELGNALKIIDHSTMFHGVPNIGDVAKIDWSAVPDVDCITGGTPPCQDFSYLGTRKGAGRREEFSALHVHRSREGEGAGLRSVG